MNRIVASAGVVVVGMAGMDAASAAELTRQQSSKWWNVAASLRAFYDDNVFQTNHKESSPGIEVEPSVAVNIPREQTLLSAKYLYRLNYYFDRPDESIDQHHEFTGRVNHRFSQRYSLNVEDSFAYSDEPEILATSTSGGVLNTFGRLDSSAIRNLAPIDFHARLTPLLGASVGYQNLYYNYEDEFRSATLDRMEHEVHGAGEYYLREETIAFLGYRFGFHDYWSDELLNASVTGDDRDARSHEVTVGMSHVFSQHLSAIARAGFEYREYFKLGQTETGPRVDVAGTYTYLPGSSVQLGVKVSRQATDLVGTDPDDDDLNVTVDQLATVFHATWTHRITARITSTVQGRFIHSIYNGGEFDGDVDQLYGVDLSLNYQINQFIAANVAYSFLRLNSKLDSDDPVLADQAELREFDRNRVWAGVVVNY